MNNQDTRNNTIGLLTSVGFHGALLLLFLFSMAWRAPGPPAAEFGVVVNMGFDDVGTGDVQTDKPVAAEEQQPEEQPKQEEPQPVVEQPKPAKVEKEEILATKEESPVVVKEEKPKKEEPKKEEPKKEEPKKVEPKKEEKLLTEYKPANNTAKTDAKGGNSEGDDVGKTGNKGQPDGDLNPDGLYKGKPGGGGGGDGNGNLAMDGWKFSETPRTSAISNNESGRIVFEIECDEDGQITKIITKEKGVTAATEAILKQELQRISLERTKGGSVATRSTGTVTFIFKSR